MLSDDRRWLVFAVINVTCLVAGTCLIWRGVNASTAMGAALLAMFACVRGEKRD